MKSLLLNADGELNARGRRKARRAVARAESIAEYAQLAKEKRETEVSSQVATKAPHRPEGGDRLAARDLGLAKDEVHRAQKIAALPEETKAAARELGYVKQRPASLAGTYLSCGGIPSKRSRRTTSSSTVGARLALPPTQISKSSSVFCLNHFLHS